MFKEIRKVLDDFEETAKRCSDTGFYSKEDENVLNYFDMNMSKALMQECYNAEKIAKIILAAKGLSNEVKIKVE